MTTVAVRSQAGRLPRRRPTMSNKSILLMNAGFGIPYSFNMQQTAVNPIFAYIGADPRNLIIATYRGALGDRTRSRRCSIQTFTVVFSDLLEISPQRSEVP